MAKIKYTVVKDVSIAGVKHAKGATFEAESKSAHIVTALHFGQIQADTEDKAPAKQPEKSEAPAKADKPEDKAPAK